MTYKRIYEGGYLAAHECEKARIDVEYLHAFTEQKYYKVKALKPILGYCSFNTLKAAKEAVEKYL